MKTVDLLQEQLKHAKTKKEQEALLKKIEKSKLGKKSRNKGSTYENKIAKLFKERFNVTLKRTPSSGGFAKEQKNEFFCGDLTCVDKDKVFNLHIEAKNHKVIRIVDWINQAKSDCINGKIPVVIFHTTKEAHKITNDFITLPLQDFFDLVDVDCLIKEGKNK